MKVARATYSDEDIMAAFLVEPEVVVLELRDDDDEADEESEPSTRNAAAAFQLLGRVQSFLEKNLTPDEANRKVLDKMYSI